MSPSARARAALDDLRHHPRKWQLLHRSSTDRKRAAPKRGPRPRGLVKRTIVMTKTRDAAVRRAVAEGRAPSASGYIDQALEAFETVQSYDELLEDARAVGELARLSGHSDVVNVHLALLAGKHRQTVLTSDPDDIERVDPRIQTIAV